jgi:hypothetical protein
MQEQRVIPECTKKKHRASKTRLEHVYQAYSSIHMCSPQAVQRGTLRQEGRSGHDEWQLRLEYGQLYQQQLYQLIKLPFSPTPHEGSPLPDRHWVL